MSQVAPTETFKTLITVVPEIVYGIQSLIPDSILFGSLVLYFLTQNRAFGVFSVFIFETALVHKLISWTTVQTVGPSRPQDTPSVACRVGFKTPQFSADRIFSHAPYPSYGMYSIVAMATYLLMATKEFSNTLNAMGAEWSSRATAAYVGTALLLVLFMIVRMYTCDTLTEILIATVFALITGLIFFYINKSIFGEEAMNFLGLPYMVTKESQGSPIYVCAAEKKE